MDSFCSNCGGELDTAFRCCRCGADNTPQQRNTFQSDDDQLVALDHLARFGTTDELLIQCMQRIDALEKAVGDLQKVIESLTLPRVDG